LGERLDVGLKPIEMQSLQIAAPTLRLGLWQRQCGRIPSAEEGPNPGCDRLGDALQCENSLLYRGREVDEHKMALVIEVILAALIDDPHQIVFGRFRIGADPVYLARDKRRSIPTL
jgi:hypothetical protein